MSKIRLLSAIILLALLVSLQSCSAQPGTTDDTAQYSQYYRVTGEAAPATYITAPQEWDIKGKEPSTLYFYGTKNPIPYSLYQGYAAYTGGYSLWIQGTTSWTQYAKVPEGSRLWLLALASAAGNGYFYEIYPSGKLVKNDYNFYPYNRIDYYAYEVGPHVLIFLLNNYPSNAVVIDVVKYSPPYEGYQQPAPYQQPATYQQPTPYQQQTGYQQGGY